MKRSMIQTDKGYATKKGALAAAKRAWKRSCIVKNGKDSWTRWNMENVFVGEWAPGCGWYWGIRVEEAV